MPAPGRTLNDMRVRQGQNKRYLVTFVDKDNNRRDLTGSTIYFVVKESDESVRAMIIKDSTDTDKVEILDQTVEGTKGQAYVKLVPSDSSDKIVGKYIYGLWEKTAAGEWYPAIEDGKFEIMSSVITLLSE
jgi:hypothetical protein